MNSKWSELKKLSPPIFNEITDINNKILLLAFFGFYNDVLNYDITLLKNAYNTNNDNLYLISSHNGQIKVMEYLENKGFDINIKNNKISIFYHKSNLFFNAL